MEQNLPWISFIRGIQDTHSFELRSKRKITSGDKPQKKKGIANILLIDFGLFVLHENTYKKSRVMYVCNMYERISNRWKHNPFSNHVYSCL